MARPKRARQATSRSWTSERDVDVGDLLEHLGGDGQQPDQRRSGTCPEHHLETPFEGEHLGIEARAGDDVGQQVLHVVEDRRIPDRVGQVEDLLLEQELLFVVEHGGDGTPPKRRDPEQLCRSLEQSGATGRQAAYG